MNALRFACPLFALVVSSLAGTLTFGGEVVGVSVTPHIQSPVMRYRRPTDQALGARIQFFVKGRARPGRFSGKTPAEWLASGDWAWHNLAAISCSADDQALAVWEINGKTARWGSGSDMAIEADGLPPAVLAIREPEQWIASISFPASGSGEPAPDRAIVWVRNESGAELAVSSVRLWLPETLASWSVLRPGEPIAVAVRIPPHELGFIPVRFAPLPLVSCDVAVELVTSAGPLWARVRARAESFDISGGWVGDHVKEEAYLRLLKHVHVNTGHIAKVPGYTDNPALYNRFPLKMFNKLEPVAEYDPSELRRIHAVEFLGEPQYGGGKPVPPQEVFNALLPYRATRLATTLTHSEERIWRNYAGLSDFPHFDAYRVVAPAADDWRKYDRWGGVKIAWGAPLETIGDMTRSLRELNRPLPCAAWSQGPHHGWDDAFSGRRRRSPTADELRAQALHALAARVTSLYWFNLSLESLLAFPDTWEPMTGIGREVRMLAPYLIEGAAYRFERRTNPAGKPDWELSSIAAPDAAVLFALDTAYTPDLAECVFRFGEPRAARFEFALPPWLRAPAEVFRVDADGPHDVEWRPTPAGLMVKDMRSRDAIYIAARGPGPRAAIEGRRRQALDDEAASVIDVEALRALLRSK